MNQTIDFENSRGSAGFSVHSPHGCQPSFLHRCVAVVVLLAGAAAFGGVVVWPLFNILR